MLPIFRSAHQLRLLGHLYVHAPRSLSIADLERETRISQSTLSREVERLSRSGLVKYQRTGRTKLVQANEASPYFPELRALLLKASGPASLLRDLLARVPGVEEAYIFGSWARRYEGEVGPAPADVDVLVVGEPDVDAVDSACRRAERRLNLEVNPVVLSRSEWQSKASGFVKQVRKGPLVPLRTRQS
ncbi:MAG: MarR family transcriptional regulator [Actinomycetota bacterium]